MIMKKDWFNFETIELKDFDGDLRSYFADLIMDGDKNHYSPIIVDDYEDEYIGLDIHTHLFNEKPRKENYKDCVDKILQVVNSKSFSYWYKRTLNEIFFKGLNDEEEKKEYIIRVLGLPNDFKMPNAYEFCDKMLLGTLSIDKLIFDNDGNRKNKNDKSSYKILKVPTDKPYEVLAWLSPANANDCPMTEFHVAFAKYFYENYNARPMYVCSDSLDYFLFESPQDNLIDLARAMIVYDNDEYNELMGTMLYIAGCDYLHFWWD